MISKLRMVRCRFRDRLLFLRRRVSLPRTGHRYYHDGEWYIVGGQWTNGDQLHIYLVRYNKWLEDRRM